MDQLILKEPIFIMARKEYATGEVTYEGTIIDNKELNMQVILTFKNKDDENKNFLKLSKSYDIAFIPIEKG